MNIDLTQPILDFEGNAVRAAGSQVVNTIINQCAPIVENIADKKARQAFLEQAQREGLGKSITIGEVIRNVLGSYKENETGDEKLKKFNLGLKCVADKVDLSDDERQTIKKLVANSQYGPIHYGRICEAFEAPEEKTEKPKKKKGKKK